MADEAPIRSAQFNQSLDEEFSQYVDEHGMSNSEALRVLVRKGLEKEHSDASTNAETDDRLQQFRDRTDQGVAFFKGFALAALLGSLVFAFSPIPALTGPAATFATLSIMFSFASFMYAYHYSLMFFAEYEAQTGSLKRKVRSFRSVVRSIIGRTPPAEIDVETEGS